MDEFIDYYAPYFKKVKKTVVEIKKPDTEEKPVIKESDEKNVQKVVITESTKAVVEKALGENLEEMDGSSVVEKVNKTKKAYARRKKNGSVEIKQVIKD